MSGQLPYHHLGQGQDHGHRGTWSYTPPTRYPMDFWFPTAPARQQSFLGGRQNEPRNNGYGHEAHQYMAPWHGGLNQQQSYHQEAFSVVQQNAGRKMLRQDQQYHDYHARPPPGYFQQHQRLGNCNGNGIEFFGPIPTRTAPPRDTNTDRLPPLPSCPAPGYHRPDMARSPGGDTADTAVSSDDGDGGVLMYIDNSNIWINTMESSVKRLGFRSDIKQDLRTRINIIKLLSMAGAGRPIIRAVLYGSEPPPVSKFWNNIKEIKFCKVDVQVTRRSTYSNREREVDQSIMLDIGVDLVIHQNHAKHGGTIILFTGDGGMVTAVRRALDYNWNVELWTYRNSLAKGYLDEVEKNDKFKIIYLDDYFQEFVFYKFEWNIRIPQERSCVLTFRKIPDELKRELLEIFVKAFTQLVRMPMAGRYFRVSEESEQQHRQTHLVIVCSVGKLVLKEDSRSDFDLKCSRSDSDGGHPSVNGKKKTAPNPTSFHFTAEAWDRTPDILQLPCLRDDPGDFNTRVKAEFEAMVDECLRNSVDAVNNPKYDFNTEVYRKIEDKVSNFSKKAQPEASLKEKLADLAVSPTNQNASPQPPHFDQLMKKYRPILRSLPQFLQDLKLESHEDIEPITLEAQGVDDDGEGLYTVQMQKRLKRKFQKYSAECKYSYRCTNGFKCVFNHTDKEKEFFKLQVNPSLRKTYKFKNCEHYANAKCKFKRGTSYLCPFSHGAFCLTCKVDDDGGHNAKTCSAPPPRFQTAPEPNENGKTN